MSNLTFAVAIVHLKTSIHSLDIWMFSFKKILCIHHCDLFNETLITLSGRVPQCYFQRLPERLTAEDNTDFKMAEEHALFQVWDVSIQGFFFQKRKF